MAHEEITKATTDEDSGLDENVLNPSPQSYRVSFFVKTMFCVAICFGLGAYTYMILDRRWSQHRFMLQNQLAAVKLIESSLPSFVLIDPLTAKELMLDTLLGKWTLLNIWASWCPPCKEEMPSLEFLQQQFKGKLSIIAVSIDDDMDVVKDFIDINKPSFTVLWDQQKVVSQKLGLEKYPESFLISPDGLLVAQFSGPRDWSSPVAIDYFLDFAK